MASPGGMGGMGMGGVGGGGSGANMDPEMIQQQQMIKLVRPHSS